jgi:hypothetical protein
VNKKYLALVFFFLSSFTYAETAVVVYKKSGCDYYIADGVRGYYVLEWYGGYDPDNGDKIIGSLSNYGMKDVYYKDHSSGRIWVEDFLLSKDEAFEMMMDKCN